MTTIVKIENAAATLADCRSRANIGDLTPAQWKGFLGRLSLGQDADFKLALAAWINEAASSPESSEALEAWKLWQVGMNKAPRKEEWLDSAAEVVEVERRNGVTSTMRCGALQATSWGVMLLAEGFEGASVKAAMDMRDGSTAAGRLRKLGMTTKAIRDRFPTLVGRATAKPRSGSVELGGSLASGRALAAPAPRVPVTQVTGLSAKLIVKALKDAGIDAETRESIWMSEPKSIKALVSAMKDADIDAETRETVWMSL
jgi:hypothetical protein